MTKTIGRYEIREMLGRGGMATVYLATDTRLDRQVALKLMDQQLTDDPSFAARFEREAKTVASLDHGSIVALYDYGEADGWLYLVMRYMKGGSLKEQIARGPLTMRQAYDVVRLIGSALDKAHSVGIIHRDLKPANILLDGDHKPYLSDFGIVKVAKGDTEFLTQTGQTLGTFAYMSPEQVMAEELDGRSDIYALGITLYEMLAGNHPFANSAGSDSAMAVAHAKGPIPDITRDNPNLPAEFAGILHKALAKNRSDRYAAGRDMALDMYNVLTGKPVVSPQPAKQAPDKPGLQVSNQEKPSPAVTPATGDLKVARKPAVSPQPEAVPPAQPPPRQPFREAAAPVITERPYGQNVTGTAPAPEPAPAAASSLQTTAPSTRIPRLLVLIQGLLTFILGVVLILSSPRFYSLQPRFRSLLAEFSSNILYNLTDNGFFRDPTFLITGYWSATLFGLYWLAIGLLTAASIFVNRGTWRWRLAVAILGISAGILSLVQGMIFSNRSLSQIQSYGLPVGILGVFIGLIEVVQSARGAGRSLGILGAFSIVFGLMFALDISPEGIMILAGGIAAIMLVLRQPQTIS